MWRSDAFALGYLASRSMLDTLFGAAGLAAADGRMIAFVEDGRAVAPQGQVGRLPHIARAVASGSTVVSSGITDAVVGKPRIAIVVPLHDEDGRVRATLTGMVDLAGPHGLAALAESSAAGGDGETRAAVVDGDDRVIASDHGDWLMQPSARTGPLARAIAGAGGAARLRGTAGAARVGDDAFAWAPVPGTGWSVMTLTPSDALFASIRAAGNRALGLAALGAGLAALGMLVVAALLLRPVARLHARALRLSEADAAGVGHAAEDLDADWPAGDDEIGALGQAFRRVLRDRAHGDAERREANASLHRQVMHDVLTGLPNRAQFRTRLEAAAANARAGGTAFALLFIDLDGFKAINDSLGHDAGDLVLRETASRLGASVRTADVVCRLGGDEFTVIAEGFDDAADVARMCERILGALRQPILCGARRVRIDGSIGMYVHDGTVDGDVDVAVQRADEAMYASKRAGKGRWTAWTPAVGRRPEPLPA